MRNTYLRGSLAALNGVAAATLVACGGGGDDAPPVAAPTVQTISSKPEYVSGGDTLVSADASLATLHAKLNGTDVTASFKQDPNNSTKVIGLVSGLTVGANTLVVDNGGLSTTLALTNWPSTGPIFSGPQITPFNCQTAAFSLPDGTKLGTAATDATATCSAPTVVQYMYKKTGGTALVPMADITKVPADAATTTTTTGAVVNFIVRIETGTMNRGVYQNAVLHDPTKDGAPTPVNAPKGWNRKLIAVHGTGCVSGWYIQGAAMGVNPYTATNFTRLGEGYAVFTNTLNHPTNSCNAIVAGETTLMGKEHFIETFGVPTATVSVGTSGGAYTSLQVADNYPGLIDGIFIDATFPDALAISMAALDDKLLNHFLTVNNAVAATTEAQMVRVSGHKAARPWYDLALQSGRTDPITGRTDTIPTGGFLGPYAPAVFNAAVPLAQRYNPTTNPKGARATVFDVARAVYGVDANGYGLRPFDNIGVQYGLTQLNDGTLTSTQFLELNEKIGGYDGEGNYTTGRTTGDLGAIKRVYQSGLSTMGGGGLASIPIFDASMYYDEDNYYHYQYFHFAVRDRLLRVNGDTKNHVMWRGGPNFTDLFVPASADPGRLAINGRVAKDGWAAFMKWVDAYKADSSSATQRQKVIADKPAEAVDGCFTAATTPVFQAETQTLASSGAAGSCNALWPSWTVPRVQAGGPLAGDTHKCQLKAIDPADYKVTLSAVELARLKAIFPNGTCDFTKAGVNQTPVVTYASFGPTPVNLVFDVTK